MSSEGGSDRVTNRELYMALRDLHGDLSEDITMLRADLMQEANKMWPRREGIAIVASALVLGQIAARLEIGAVSIPVPTPQTLELLYRILN